MNLLPLQITLQAVSSLAIFGGLLFTAIQFRHWRKAQHVANFTKLVELQMELRRMRVDDPRLAHVYKDDVKDLHSDDEIRAYFFNLMQLSVFEIVWFSHAQGQLPEVYFQSWMARMRVIEMEDSFRKMISNPSMKILHDEFQKFVTEMTERTNHGESKKAFGAQE